MKGKNYRIFLLLFCMFCGLSHIAGHNIDVTNVDDVKDTVLESVFNTFYDILQMSKYFERFPLNDTFYNSQYHSQSSSSQIPTDFHDRLLGVLLDYNISHDCRHGILEVNSGLQNREDWAIRMIDAFGKPVAGLLDLSFKWLGSYDECVNSHSHREWLLASFGTDFNTSSARDIRGLYCTTKVPVPFSMVPDSSAHLVREWFPPEVLFGGCYPDTCSETDVSHIVRAVADHVHGSSSDMSVKVQCQRKRDFSAGAIVVMVCLGIIGVMLIIGTAYDVLHIRLNLFSKFNKSSVKHEETIHLNDIDTKEQIIKIKGEAIINGKTSVNGDLPFTNGATPEYNGNHKGYESSSATCDVNKLDVEMETTHNTANDVTLTQKEPESNWHILLMSFSVVKNTEVVLNTDVSGDRVNAIEGIRALSMAWIIVIHILMYGAAPSANVDMYVADNMNDWTFLALFASFGVDTFFIITGFLVVYLSLKKLSKIGVGQFPWGKYYFSRFWRISPTFYIVFFAVWLIWPQVSSGPMWEWGSPLSNCSQLWWQTILYFNNFYGAKTNACFGSSWYIAVDLQLFIFSPIFIILFKLKPKAGLIVSGVAIFASAVYGGVIAGHFKLNSALIVGPNKEPKVDDLMTYMHLFPFSHIAPYVVGMLIAYLVFNYKETINITRRMNLIGWFLSLSMIPLLVYLPFRGSLDDRKQEYSAFLPILYAALSKFLWACAVGWVIFACALGKGGIINKFLSWAPFIVLGRLTFCNYLTHVLVSHIYFWPRRTLFYFSDVEMVYMSATMITLSFVVAYIVAVCVEQPSCFLLKILLKNQKK